MNDDDDDEEWLDSGLRDALNANPSVWKRAIDDFLSGEAIGLFNLIRRHAPAEVSAKLRHALALAAARNRRSNARPGVKPKLSRTQVEFIRIFHAQNIDAPNSGGRGFSASRSHRELAGDFGISVSLVRDVVEFKGAYQRRK